MRTFFPFLLPTLLLVWRPGDKFLFFDFFEGFGIFDMFNIFGLMDGELLGRRSGDVFIVSDLFKADCFIRFNQ